MIRVEKYLPSEYPLAENQIPERFLDSIFTVENGNEELGRIALFQNPNLGVNAFSAGCFQVKNDFKISQKLLVAAAEVAKKKGAKKLIGPMNGSTWENYRFAENSGHTPFFMEPTQPDYYQKNWERFGFVKKEEYFSSVSECFDFPSDQEEFLDEKFKKEGIRIENFNSKNIEKSLRELAGFNNAAFAKNDFFSPIDEADFVKKYRKIIPLLDPELIFLAKAGSETVGLIFNYQDLNAKSEKVLITKSIARLPNENLRGLFPWMYSKVLRKAKEKGFQKVIHALMKSGNFSIKRSEQFGGKIFRKYWLYELNLE